MKVLMQHVKQTKNTYVYEGFDESSKEIIPTLYINKSAFKDKAPPQFINVEITEGQQK